MNPLAPTLEELPTIDLVQRTQAGDPAAREALFARYRARVLAIARVRLSAKLRATVESGDILQEALLEAVRGIDRFEMREESSLIRWLAVLVERRLTARARHENTWKRSGGAQPLVNDPPSDTPEPAEAVGSGEDTELVQAALAALPERSRELVLLRDYAGASWDSIATELGFASPDAARMMHARALVKLGAELRARGLRDED